MERERVEKFIGQRVRVDLEWGQNLAGQLSIPNFSPRQFEVVAMDGVRTLLGAEDVADIMILHAAEEAAMERGCACTQADPMSWTTCPKHSFEGQ